MKQTSLRGIAKKAARDKTHRFGNLFGLLNIDFLLWCWQFVNKKASMGIDRIDAPAFGMDLLANVCELVDQLRNHKYRAKLVLRKYIPKLGVEL